MEPETMDGVVDAAQYPVDAVTADAMTTDVGPKGLGMSLDDLVRESKPAGGGRGGRGHKGEGGRLKVRAVIVKRPAGGGRGFGGRGPAPPRKTPGKIYKRDDGVVVLHMYGKDVLAANNQGEVTLDADGDRGKNTFLGVHDALSRFGFKLSRPNPAAPEEWSVSDGKKFLKRYEDGMVIPAPKPPGPGRMLALLQTEVRAGSGGGRGRGGGGFGGRGRGRGSSYY